LRSVRRRGIGWILALGAALLLFALGGCGGSGSNASTGASNQSSPSETTGAKTNGGDSGAGAAKKGAGGRKSGNATEAKVRTAPLKVSGGGSAQYRVKGGDNSVQEFGEESDEAELEEAATALHGYLVARAEEDWPAACAQLAKPVQEELQTFASRSEKLSGKSCPAILQALTPPLPPSARHESTIVDAGSLRVEGKQAFLIYYGAEKAAYTVLMVPEDGWKVGSLAATPLS
jgi:hypothetical protein